MIRSATVAALLLLISLAGCLGEDGGVQGDPSPTAGDDGAPQDGNETEPSANETDDPADATGGSSSPPNAPPTANVTANVTNGSIPLSVAFNLTGEDADGDDLSWTFDADGDGEADAAGTELPASFEFTYEESGNYTATLNVTDGQATVGAELLIVVEVPPPAGPAICDRPNATAYGGTVYTLEEGGTWVFRESNDIPGLQVGNTHATGPDGGGLGFANPAWADCEDGDHMVF